MTPLETSLPLCICGDSQCDVPYGFCHCKCGQKTSIAKQNSEQYGWQIRRPKRFLNGHRRIFPVIDKAEPFKIDGVYCRLIPLTQGQWTIVWESDYEWLMQWKWTSIRQEGGYHYAARSIRIDGVDTWIRMHRLITNAPDGIDVDHEFGNTLDNRRDVLRVASEAENQRNKRKHRDNKSGYKGVTFHPQTGKWRAQIMVDGNKFSLGLFATPELAHAAYCVAAAKYHKEFARFN